MYKNHLAIIIILLLPALLLAQEKKGIIRGKVVNISTNEPIPFSTVQILGTSIGAMTDFDGNFSFTGIDPGYKQLKGSSVGFNPAVSSEFLLTRDNSPFIELGLEEMVTGIDEVVVKASPFRKKIESPVSVRIIGIQEIEKNPGGNRDISKVIQSFPGVASTPAFRNDVIVRGGGPNENRFFLDEIEIPYLNHFSTQGASGGPVGIINVDFVQELSFYSGAFPASKGNALSSVLSFRQIDGNNEKMKYRATLGASDLGLTIDGPTGENSSLILSVRRSYLQFLFSAIGLPFLPTYNDFQFKHKTKIGDKGELTVLGIGALDDFALNTDANETEYQRYILDYIPVQKQYSYTFGIKYKHFLDNGYDTWILSRSFLNNNQYKYLNNEEIESQKLLDYRSREGENKLRYERVSQYDNGMKVDYGLSFENVLYRNNTEQLIYSGTEVISNSRDIYFRTNKYALHGQLSQSYYDGRLSLSAGLRFDGSSYSKSMANPLKNFSPRVSASIIIGPDVSFNFNIGRYQQLPPYTSMGYADTNNVLVNKNNGLKYIISDHVVAGFEYLPSTNLQLTVEGFYKYYRDYPFSLKDSIPLASKSADYGVFGDEEVKSISDGRSYGIEFLGRIKNLNGLNMVFSYTWVRSEFKDAEGSFIPTSWDNRHIFNFTATRQVFKNWDIGIKWRFVGGAPYTPYDFELSSLQSAWDLQGRGYLDYSRYNSERLKSFHQLDLRVDRSFYFDKWSLMIYADVQNVYNFQADQPPILIRQSNQDGVPLPDPSFPDRYLLKYLDGSSGTVLPTIGVIIEF